MRRFLFILYSTVVIMLLSQSVTAWDLPLDIDVTKIYFNHDSGSTSGDGITIQEDQTTITAPEWYPAASKNEESAYLMSVAAPTVKAEFYANDILEGYSTVTVYADFVSGDGSWELAEATMGFPGGGSGQVSFSTNVSYPQTSSVGKRSVTWTWKVTQVNGQSVSPFSIGTSTHTYYKVLAEPQEPMEIPWVEVLDYSCVWASGQTTATGAATVITQGIYNDLGLMYDRYQGGPYYGSRESGSFNLTEFLDDIPGYNIQVICYDTGQALVIFGNAVGCGLTYRLSSYRMNETFGYLNCVKPVGLSWTNNPFYGTGNWVNMAVVPGDLETGRSYFWNHAFAAIGTADNPTYVYDACMKVDTDGDPDDGPSFTESWLTGESWYVTSGNYNQKVIDNLPTHQYSTGPARMYSFDVE